MRTGFITHVPQMQTDTGIKDAIANVWIELIIERVIKLKQERPNITPDEMETELRQWLDEQPGEKMNPLLSMAGTFFIHQALLQALICSGQVSIQPATLPWKFFTPFFLVW
jgi:hypothetical protein